MNDNEIEAASEVISDYNLLEQRGEGSLFADHGA